MSLLFSIIGKANAESAEFGSGVCVPPGNRPGWITGKGKEAIYLEIKGLGGS